MALAEQVAAPVGRRIARASDRALDLVVIGFAAWTLAYDACLLLGLGSAVAGAATAIALAAGAWLTHHAPVAAPARVPVARGRRPVAAAGIALALGGLGAALFAYTWLPWWAVWPLWLGAATAALAGTLMRREMPRASTGGAAAALPWAVVLAVLSLVLTRSDGDDAQYGRLAAWVAEHGRFPVRDVLFSDERLPAIFSPPLSSFEALAGTIARLTGLAAPTVVYLVVAPVAAALSALALWRLLRAWGVGRTGVALSAALLFLLWDGAEPQALGDLFVGRIWQGKIVFACVLVPLALALVHEHAARPSRRGLALLVAAGIAAVGLTTTGVFVAPVLAAGAALGGPWRRALPAVAAVAAYPLSAAVVSLVTGARNAQVYLDAQVEPSRLAHLVFGSGPLAFAGATLLLAGALAVPRPGPARTVAAISLLVVGLLAPGMPHVIFRATDLGQILWRVTWAVPIAALAGAALARARWPLAVAGLAAVLACGVPVWSSPGSLGFAAPGFKRTAGSLAGARQALAAARPDDVVLAPRAVSETVLVISGDVYTVAPRPFYATALAGVPGGHAADRMRLLGFAELGVDAPGYDAHATRAALRGVGVDVACVPPDHDRALAALRASGYRVVSRSRALTCSRAR